MGSIEIRQLCDLGVADDLGFQSIQHSGDDIYEDHLRGDERIQSICATQACSQEEVGSAIPHFDSVIHKQVTNLRI